MALNIQLNRIQNDSNGKGAVPIFVTDSSSPFKYTGSITATIQGDPEDLDILWEQVTGVPVNFTTALDGLTIEFTTNDLDRKEFVVYTNKGKNYERSDTAQFYHFPISMMTTTGCNTGVNISLDGYLKDLKLITINGMVPKSVNSYNFDEVYDKNLEASGHRTDPKNRNTIYKVETTSNIEAINRVTKSFIEEEVSEGVWSRLSSIDGFIDEFTGYPLISNPIRVIYTTNGYGTIIEDIVYLSSEINSGLSSVMGIGSGQFSDSSYKVNNFVSNLQQIKNEVITEEANLVSGDSNYTISNFTVNHSILSKLTNLTNVTSTGANCGSSINNLSVILSTSTGVT